MTTSATGKIKASRVNNLDASTYVGPEGQIWYDVNTGILRLGDNVTPGGTIIGGGSGNGSPTGPGGAVQFNNGGSFGGTSGLIFDSTANTLSVTGNVSSNIIIAGTYLYANGQPLNPGSDYSNANVSAFLPTYTGDMDNLANVVVLGTITGNLTGAATRAGTVTTNAQPNITSVGPLTSVTVTGNVRAAGYFFANGQSIGAYGNSNVAAYLPTNTSNVSGNYIIGDGSLLSNITAGNITGAYSNSNVANYLPTYSGNMTIDNLTLNGIEAAANINATYIRSDNYLNANGEPLNFTYGNSNVSAFLKVYTGNIGNVNNTRYIHGNGAFITGIVASDLGGNVSVTGNIQAGVDLSALGNVVSAGNVLAGNVSAVGNIQGSYILGNGSQLTGLPAGYANSNAAAYFASGNNSSNIVTTGNIQGSYILGNGSQLTGLPAGYSNAEAAAYFASGNNSSNIITTGNIQASYVLGNGSQLTGLPAGYANSNVVAYGESGWAGNIMPAGNAVYSLGNATNQWKDLWVSNSTIYLDSVPLSTSPTGNTVELIFNGAPVVTSGPNAAPITTNISTTANVSGNNIISNTVVTTDMTVTNINPDGATVNIGNVTIALDNITVPGFVSATGNIATASFFLGDGGLLGNINAGNLVGGYGNANVADYLANGSDPTIVAIDSDISNTNSNVANLSSSTANSFIAVNANVANTNANVANTNAVVANNSSNISVLQGNVISISGAVTSLSGVVYTNANVANYLPVFSGNLGAGNVNATGRLLGNTLQVGSGIVTGNLTVQGNLISVNTDNLNVANALIGIGRAANNQPLTSNDGLDRGEQLWYFTDAEYSAFIGYQNASGNIVSAANVTIANGIVSVNEWGNTEVGNLYANGGVSTPGNVTANNIIATELTGTLTTAAQPNVTSVGTLTSLEVSGTANIGFISGDGSNIGNLTGANVTGVVSNAQVAVTVSDNAQPNITSVGTLSTLSVTGNIDGGNVNTVIVNATDLGGTLTTNAQPNITSVGSLTSLSVLGNATTGNLSTGNIVATTVGGNLTTNAQPNITSTGVLTSLSVTGAANTGSINTGAISATTVAGNLTTNAQPNITSTGVLTSLSVTGAARSGTVTTGNVTAGNVSATGNIYATTFIGNFQGNISGNIVVPGATGDVLFNNGGNAGADSGLVYTSGTQTLSASGNIAAGVNVSAVGNIVGSYILGNGAFLTGLPEQYGNSNVAAYLPTYTGNIGGNLTTAAQTNITSVGTLTSLSVNGNVTAGNISTNGILNAGTILAQNANPNRLTVLAGGVSATGNISTTGNILAAGAATVTGNIATAGYFLGDGGLLANIQAGNLVGAYSNANVANYLPTFSGNVGGTLTTNAQPYVTSTGTLTALSVSGNVSTSGNLSVAGNTVLAGALTVAGDTTLQGNLSVQGNVTFTNSNVITTNDKYVILANNQSTSAGVNGAGIVAGNPTVASLLYNDPTASWQASVGITPVANNAVDLGGSSNRWNNLYANNVTATAIAGTLSTAAQPNITSVGTLGTLSVTGNIGSGSYLLGNGAFISGLPAGYSNADTANYLANGNDPTIGNIQGNIATLQGNVVSLTGSIANTNSNISNLSNIVASNSNDIITLQGNVVTLTSDIANTNANVANVANTAANNASNITTLQGEVTSLTGNVYGNANVAVYLPTYTGVMTAVGNIESSGLVSATGNVSGDNIIAATDVSAVGNIYAGTEVFGQTGFFNANLFVGPDADTTVLTNPVIIGRSAGATFIQGALFNDNPDGSADWQAYAANGNDTQGWVDVGMTGNTFSDPAYTITKSNDGYLFAQGVSGVGGNLVLATGEQGGVGNSDIVFAVNGFDETNEILRIESSANILLPYVDDSLSLGSDTKHFANAYIGNVLATTAVSTAGNVTGGNINTAGNINGDYFNTVGGIMSGNLTVTGQVVALGGINASVSGTITNAINVVGNAQGNITSVGNLTGLSVTGNILQNGAGNIISAQGNVYANNLSTTNDTTVGGLFSAVGNVQINGFTTISNNAIVTGNLTVQGNLQSVSTTNLNVSNAIIGIGRAANNQPLTTNDGFDRGEQLWYFTDDEYSAFVGWQNSTGNIVLASNATITNNVVTVNQYGSATMGNINTQGVITATGNIYGANVITTGLVSGTTLTGAQVNTGNISISGNIVAVTNVSVAGVVSAAGDVIGANILTVGNVSATGNAIAGNVLTAGLVSATGAVYGSSFVGLVNGNSVVPSYTTQTVSANVQTITLSNASSYTQFINGGYAGTIVALPDATTATVGATYSVINNTGNAVSVQTSSGVVIAAQNNSRGIYTLLGTANNNSNTWTYATQVATGGNTGSGVYVLGTAPTFTNSFDGTATFNAFASVNTLNLGNGITELNLGGNSAVTSNTVINLGVATIGSGNTKTVNIGTNGAANSATNVVIGTNTANATSRISLLGNVVTTGTLTAASFIGSVVYGNNIAIGNLAVANNALGISIGYQAGGSGSTQKANAIAIGQNAGFFGQGLDTIAIGSFAANINQGNTAIAIGQNAGFSSQGLQSVAVGQQAGQSSQGNQSVAVGVTAGQVSQGGSAVAIGEAAARSGQGGGAVAMGYIAGQNNQGANSIAIGYNAGTTSQVGNSVAVGAFAATTRQQGGAVAVGSQAAQISQQAGAIAIGGQAAWTTQGTAAIAIGNSAATLSQGGSAIAIGYSAAGNTQSSNAIAIGTLAGLSAQGNASIAIGIQAGASAQGANAVAIGQLAGLISQQASTVAVGQLAGWSGQGTQSVAIGYLAGTSAQGTSAVAIGYSAGGSGQGNVTVAIGWFAGSTGQQGNAVAIGSNAGTGQQGANSIAIGTSAASSSQQGNAIALGYQAAQTQQGTGAIAIGLQAGQLSQGSSALAVGYSAGISAQGNNSVAVGYFAGAISQTTNAVAIGRNAGYQAQGANAVAVGYGAGFSGQATNTIILNATGSNLTGATANAFYVAPVRNDSVTAIGNVAVYNTTTNELAYSNTISLAGNISAGYFFGNGSLLTGIITSVANINNGNTNVTAYANANVAVTIAGVANTVVFTTTGVSVAGNVSAGNVSGGFVTIANAISIPATAVANGTGATTVYTASSANVEAVQLTVRAQIGSPTTSVQMLQIMAAQDFTGNVSYTVYDRVNTDTAVAAIPVTVTTAANVISVALNSSSTTYYTLGVTEFAKT